MLLVPFRGPLWGPFGVRDGGPGRPKLVFFWPRQRLSVFLVPGGVWGCFWEAFGPLFWCLEMSFVDEFEKIRVFVRCVNSILTPDFLLLCYRYGCTSAIFLAQLPCHVNMSVLFSDCCASTCVYVCFSSF